MSGTRIARARRGRRRLSALAAAVAMTLLSVIGAGVAASPAQAQQPGFVYADAGDAQTCALATTTAVAYCWGANGHGESTPPWGWTFKQIATGWEFSCGLGGDGVVTCWGKPHYGVFSPGRQQWTVPGTFKQIDISPTGFTGCGILVSGSLRCWDGWDGSTASSTATSALPPSGTFISVAADRDFSCGVRSNFTAVCWGDYRPFPKTDGSFVQVTKGNRFTCFLKLDQNITCQGENANGQAPSLVVGPFTSVSAGGAHACGLRTTGTIVCWGAWGAADFGQTKVPAGTWKQVSAGYYHTCGIRSDNMLVCWGDNSSGQRV